MSQVVLLQYCRGRGRSTSHTSAGDVQQNGEVFNMQDPRYAGIRTNIVHREKANSDNSVVINLPKNYMLVFSTLAQKR